MVIHSSGRTDEATVFSDLKPLLGEDRFVIESSDAPMLGLSLMTADNELQGIVMEEVADAPAAIEIKHRYWSVPAARIQTLVDEYREKEKAKPDGGE